MVNNGPVEAGNITAKLRTTSAYVIRLDFTTDYDTITTNGGTSAGDNFLVTIPSSTPEGINMPLLLFWKNASDDNATINLVCGIVRYARTNYNVDNAMFSVTKWGPIGYLWMNNTDNSMKQPATPLTT